MVLASRARKHFHAPVPRHLDRHVSRRAKTIQRQASALLDSGNSQAAEADDPRAKERRRLLIFKILRDTVHKIFGRNREFSVASVNCIACKFRMVAEVFHSFAAVFASLISAVQPGNSDSRAYAQAARAFAQLLDDAYNLMPGNYGKLSWRQLAFDHV